MQMFIQSVESYSTVFNHCFIIFFLFFLLVHIFQCAFSAYLYIYTPWLHLNLRIFKMWSQTMQRNGFTPGWAFYLTPNDIGIVYHMEYHGIEIH